MHNASHASSSVRHSAGARDLDVSWRDVDVLQVMLDPTMAGLFEQIDVVSSGSTVQYFSAMPILYSGRKSLSLPRIGGFDSGGTCIILVAALTSAIVRASKVHKNHSQHSCYLRWCPNGTSKNSATVGFVGCFDAAFIILLEGLET